MVSIVRFAVIAALLPVVLAACSGKSAGLTASQTGSPPAGATVSEQSRPTAIRLDVTGTPAPVLGTGDRGKIELLRDGSKEPIPVAFQNGALAVQDLSPGHYSIAKIGPLQCRGLEFDVNADTGGRALGTLRTQVIETRYHVAMIAPERASAADIAAVAALEGAASEAIDAEPLVVSESAPCFVNRDGPGTTWRERPLGEQIMLGVFFLGLCAGAVAAGGFCMF